MSLLRLHMLSVERAAEQWTYWWPQLSAAGYSPLNGWVCEVNWLCTSEIKTFKNEVKSRDGTITVIGTSRKRNETRKWSYGKANIAEVAYWNLTIYTHHFYVWVHHGYTRSIGIDAPKGFKIVKNTTVYRPCKATKKFDRGWRQYHKYYSLELLILLYREFET